MVQVAPVVKNRNCKKALWERLSEWSPDGKAFEKQRQILLQYWKHGFLVIKWTQTTASPIRDKMSSVTHASSVHIHKVSGTWTELRRALQNVFAVRPPKWACLAALGQMNPKAVQFWSLGYIYSHQDCIFVIYLNIICLLCSCSIFEEFDFSNWRPGHSFSGTWYPLWVFFYNMTSYLLQWIAEKKLRGGKSRKENV